MKMIVFILSGLVLSTFGEPQGCTHQENSQPLITEAPQLIQEVANGAKYTIQYDGRQFYLLNLTGSHYEMGYAYGQLFKEELPGMIKEFFSWADTYIQNNVTFVESLPDFMKKMVGKLGVGVAKKLLSVNYLITKKYTEKKWEEEFKGIADGSGVSVDDIRQINLIPELLQASCSVLGVWGEATQESALLQLRALDWEPHSPMSKYPAIVVYHSNLAGSVPFANIAWIGFVGSLTGISTDVAVSERLHGAAQKDMSRFGKPWTYALRDTMQFSHGIDEALNYLNNTARTCSVWFGIGSRTSNTYRIVEYSKAYFNVYDDHNWQFSDIVPQMNNVLYKAYYDGRTCFRDILQKEYGNISPETLFRRVAPMSETGDSQVAVMDLTNHIVYVMYPQYGTWDYGYNRPILKIDLKPFFGEQ